MSECCHNRSRLGPHDVLHVCNRKKDHEPPCVFELYEKPEPVDPDWTILRVSRNGEPVAILGLPLVIR